MTVSKGADSVDFALVNMVQTGNIVITQDYGLSAMRLVRKAVPIHQNGIAFNTYQNDEGLTYVSSAGAFIKRAKPGFDLRNPRPTTH